MRSTGGWGSARLTLSLIRDLEPINPSDMVTPFGWISSESILNRVQHMAQSDVLRSCDCHRAFTCGRLEVWRDGRVRGGGEYVPKTIGACPEQYRGGGVGALGRVGERGTGDTTKTCAPPAPRVPPRSTFNVPRSTVQRTTFNAQRVTLPHLPPNRPSRDRRCRHTRSRRAARCRR